MNNLERILKQEMEMVLACDLTVDDWVLRIFHRLYNGEKLPTDKDWDDFSFSMGCLAGFCNCLREGGVQLGTKKRVIKIHDI